MPGSSSNGDSTESSASNPGKPSDALDAFLKAAVAWPNGTDPAISTAVQVGWRSSMIDDWARSAAEEVARIAPGLQGSDEAKQVFVDQIVQAVASLTAASAKREGDPAAGHDDPGAVTSQAGLPVLVTPAGSPDPAPGHSGNGGGEQGGATEGRPAAAAELDTQDVYSKLYAKDALLGRAAYLGYELRTLCWPEGDAPLDDASVQRITTLLTELATKLPDHAAHTVLNSLALLQAGYHGNAIQAQVLHDQGEIWRAFLAGDVAPKDRLHATDYVGTADQLAESIFVLLRRTLKPHGRLALLWAVAAALVVIGVVLLIVFRNDLGGVFGGLTSLLAAVGVTWKAVGQFFGTPAAKAEKALWDAQLDWTIAYRSTLGVAGATNPTGKMKTLSRAQQHVRLWKTWNAAWPSSSFEAEQKLPAIPAATRRQIGS